MVSGIRRVCFVQTELLGHRRAGGIATATSYIARLLGRSGHDVLLLDASAADQSLSSAWLERYAADGVAIERLGRDEPISPGFLADSTRVYRHLRDRGMDAIVFQDWLGLGYASMAAKRTGAAFGRTRLVHIVHGPSEWLWEANEDVTVPPEEIATAHLERRAAEYADTIVGPSAYLLGWMADAGWALPSDRRVIPYATPALLGEVQPVDPSTKRPALVRELVFFGRYEERKGVRVFIDALNRVTPALLAGVRVTFLGRAAPYSIADLLALFDESTLAAIDGPHFVTDLDSHAARAYLREPGRVAFIPSLVDNSPNVVIECLEDGISFVASTTGGVPELVAAADRGHVLVDPVAPALAERVRVMLVEGVTPRPARPAYTIDQVLPAWRDVLEPPVTPSPAPSHPLVTAVVPHFAQPDYVRHAITSLLTQDYPSLEIVVVDDGTPDPAAVAALESFVAAQTARNVRLIRQANRYLGAARNAGTGAARGELVVYLDDDDVVEADYVSTMVRALQTSGAAAATCAMRTYDDDGGRLEGPDSGSWVFTGDAVHLAPIWNLLGGAACIVRRDAWAAVGGFHERHGVGHEDWDFLVRLQLAGHEVASVPEPLYRYRVRPSSMIRSTTRYRNMQPVFQSLAAALPPVLRSWPFQLCASQSVLERTAPERSRLLALEARLQAELAALAARPAPPPSEPTIDPVIEVARLSPAVNGSAGAAVANGTARRPGPMSGRIGVATASLRRAGSARLRLHR